MTFRPWRPAAASDVAPAIALLSGLVSAVWFWAQRQSLWEDEIIAITHGLQPFPGFFVEVVRNDIHPFLYFLFVKIWASAAIGSDSWVIASSLAAVLFSAAVVALVGRRIYGRNAALWAAALFLVLPTTSWSAANLRMYGLMPGIAVLCWLANCEALRTGRRGWLWATLLLQLAQTYLHAIGFFFAAFFALAALVEQRRDLDRGRLMAWIGVQALTLLGMLPVVASALVRGTEPLGAPTLASVLVYPAEAVSIWGATPLMLVVGGATFLALLGFALSSPRSRTATLVICCGSLATAVVLGSLGKTIFKPPVFAASITPFLALGAAGGIAWGRAPGCRAVAATCALALSVALWLGTVHRQADETYRPAADYLATNVRAGDVVVIPSPSVYWGVLRYAVGPRWGYPLDIMPLQANSQWARLTEKLGPAWANRLGLIPRTNVVDDRGVRYLIGGDLSRLVPAPSRLWVVHRRLYEERGQEAITPSWPGPAISTEPFGNELSVTLMDKGS
jgi:mannosyltransferase